MGTIYNTALWMFAVAMNSITIFCDCLILQNTHKRAEEKPSYVLACSVGSRTILYYAMLCYAILHDKVC